MCSDDGDDDCMERCMSCCAIVALCCTGAQSCVKDECCCCIHRDCCIKPQKKCTAAGNHSSRWRGSQLYSYQPRTSYGATSSSRDTCRCSSTRVTLNAHIFHWTCAQTINCHGPEPCKMTCESCLQLLLVYYAVISICACVCGYWMRETIRKGALRKMSRPLPLLTTADIMYMSITMGMAWPLFIVVPVQRWCARWCARLVWAMADLAQERMDRLDKEQ